MGRDAFPSEIAFFQTAELVWAKAPFDVLKGYKHNEPMELVPRSP